MMTGTIMDPNDSRRAQEPSLASRSIANRQNFFTTSGQDDENNNNNFVQVNQQQQQQQPVAVAVVVTPIKSDSSNNDQQHSPYYIEGLQLPQQNLSVQKNDEKLIVDHGPALNKQEIITTEVFGKK